MRVRRSQHLERYRIRGGNRLHGEVEISGAKNAAVAIIPAALMVNGKCRIENLPQISDTEALLLILESLGAKVEQIDRSTVEIDATNATWMGADYDRMRKIRASYYFVGSMLGRFGIARTTMPGGCNFGVRPIDQHVKGMNALGAEVDISDFITAHVPGGRLRGASVYLDKVSVGATMNIMIAAVLAEGRTIIENAARGGASRHGHFPAPHQNRPCAASAHAGRSFGRAHHARALRPCRRSADAAEVL